MCVSRRCMFALAFALLSLPLAAQANGAAAQDPVSTAIKASLKRSQNIMVAAAEEMPADKYGFKPTPESMSFGQLILHVATSNEGLCAEISGAAPAPKTDLTATSSKNDLVTLLKSAFDYCVDSLANVNDANLGKMVGSGRRPMTQAAAMISLSDDLADHYSQEAAYLRLNGLLPPTAQGSRGRGM